MNQSVLCTSCSLVITPIAHNRENVECIRAELSKRDRVGLA